MENSLKSARLAAFVFLLTLAGPPALPGQTTGGQISSSAQADDWSTSVQSASAPNTTSSTLISGFVLAGGMALHATFSPGTAWLFTYMRM